MKITGDLEIAQAEINEAIKLEKRIANCGDTLELYEEDRLIIGHLLDFVQDNFKLYVKHIAKERSSK